MTSNSTRIYVIQARNLVRTEKGRQTCLRLPVVRCIAELADDETTHEGAACLHKLLRGTIVSNKRIGHRENLSAERGVGQALLIPRHGGGEDDLAYCFCSAVEQLSRIDSAVLKNQFSFHTITTPSFITIRPSTTVNTALPLSLRPTKGE